MTAYSFDPAKASGENATVGNWEERLQVAAPDWYDYKEVYGTDTSGLVADFKEALRQLEELIYAIMGSMPKYSTTPSERLQWWQRDNPRCLWPEQRTTERHFGPFFEVWDYYKYPADGNVTAGQNGVRVPIRSQSGDPTKQYAEAQHGPGFGLGSVERDHSVAPFDPPHDEATEIRWTPVPDEVFGVSGVEIVSTVGTYVMSLVSGTYKGTIPAQVQGTVVKWYLDVSFSPHAELFALFEPQRPGSQTQPPNLEDQYSYVSFTHVYGPYAWGLPELMTRYGEYDPDDSEASIRQGTETWEFNSMEDIQPEHINMARFALDYLGTKCHHNPNGRGAAINCCYSMEIEWRWSGSARHWAYVIGAKGSNPSDTAPLTNHPSDTQVPNQEAIRSWRGLAMLFKEDPFGIGAPDNFYYGGDESWLTKYPDIISDPLDGPSATMFDDGEEAGLQPDDVIDPIHLKEIIDAVDYLINNGCWRLSDIFSERKSPMTAHQGVACGYWETKLLGIIQNTCNGQCCEECNFPFTMAGCVPYSAPTWGDCQGQHRWCAYQTSRSTTCTDEEEFDWQVQTGCSVGAVPDPGGGDATFDSIASGVETTPHTTQSSADAFGWSAFICTPAHYMQAPGEGDYGPPDNNPMWTSIDTDHGNGFRTDMRRIDNPGGEDEFLTAEQNSMGNSFEGVVICKNDNGSVSHVAAGFEEVHGVKWDGVAVGWLNDGHCVPGSHYIGRVVGPIPGLGHHDADGGELCIVGCWSSPPPGGNCETACGVGESDFCPAGACACGAGMVWVRVDLNLQGGIPRLKDYDITITGLDDEGAPVEAIPWDYCPCDTEHNRSDACVAGWPG